MNLKRKLVVGVTGTAATIIVNEALRPFRKVLAFFKFLLFMMCLNVALLMAALIVMVSR